MSPLCRPRRRNRGDNSGCLLSCDDAGGAAKGGIVTGAGTGGGGIDAVDEATAPPKAIVCGAEGAEKWTLLDGAGAGAGARGRRGGRSILMLDCVERGHPALLLVSG